MVLGYIVSSCDYIISIWGHMIYTPNCQYNSTTLVGMERNQGLCSVVCLVPSFVYLWKSDLKSRQPAPVTPTGATPMTVEALQSHLAQKIPGIVWKCSILGSAKQQTGMLGAADKQAIEQIESEQKRSTSQDQFHP